MGEDDMMGIWYWYEQINEESQKKKRKKRRKSLEQRVKRID